MVRSSLCSVSPTKLWTAFVIWSVRSFGAPPLSSAGRFPQRPVRVSVPGVRHHPSAGYEMTSTARTVIITILIISIRRDSILENGTNFFTFTIRFYLFGDIPLSACKDKHKNRTDQTSARFFLFFSPY